MAVLSPLLVLVRVRTTREVLRSLLYGLGRRNKTGQRLDVGMCGKVYNYGMRLRARNL